MRTLAATLLVLVPALASAAPKRHAVDTDAGVRAAVKEVAELELSDQDLTCVRRLTGPFAKVVLIGVFVYDRGCKEKGYFADGVWVPGRTHATPALALAGWADPAQRIALALAWAEEGLDMTSLRAGFADTSPAKAEPDGKGGVIIEGWRTLPTGMVPVKSDQRVKIVITAAGEAMVGLMETKSTPIHHH